MTYRVNHFINGKITENSRNTLQDIYNPATGEVIGHVAIGEKGDVEQAVSAALSQFPRWAITPSNKRAQILFRFRELLLQHKNELAQMITREHGKTIIDAEGSIQRGIDVVEFACGIPSHLQTRYSSEIANGIDGYSLRQPLGVCCGITPFNFPAMIALWMFPIAIACGNTFILKPSEKDPSVSLRIAELVESAGLPSGVFNVVQGSQVSVESLLTHPDIKAISFVGSTAVAEQVYKTATMHGKRAQVFGGAKNHAVIMPDADIEQAADAIMGAAYGSAGERCMAISVVVCIGDSLADKLIETLIPRVKQLKIGAGTEKVDMGPLVTSAHLEKVTSYLSLGIEEGAALLVDGRMGDRRSPLHVNNMRNAQRDVNNMRNAQHVGASGARLYKSSENKNGFYLGGSLFDHVQSHMRIYKEEIFGPVLCVMRVKSFDEALHLVNSCEYGNGSAIFTRDGHAGREFAHKVQTGMVGINIPIPVPVAHFSFGGWKRSIFGDIDMHGPEGVQFYTKLKTVTLRFPQESVGAEFSMPVMK